MIAELLAAFLMSQTNPKKTGTYPVRETLSFGNVFWFNPQSSAYELAKNSSGERSDNTGPIKEVFATSGDSSSGGLRRLYADYTPSTPLLIGGSSTAEASATIIEPSTMRVSAPAPRLASTPSSTLAPTPQSVVQPDRLAPSYFWWRYIRGIWPTQQHESVVAASEGTNVIFATETDLSSKVIAHYVIVLPEDRPTKRATVTLYAHGNMNSVTIEVPPLNCNQLKDNTARIAAARVCAFTIDEQGKTTIQQPAPITNNSRLVTLVTTALATAEVNAGMREAVDKFSEYCP